MHGEIIMMFIYLPKGAILVGLGGSVEFDIIM